jgi:putative salt-induced outer membrane protein
MPIMIRVTPPLCAAMALALTAVRPAFADDLPQGTATAKPASAGTTNVTSEKFEAAVPRDESKDATELSLSLGGLASSGNSRMLSLTSSDKLRVRRSDDQFSAAIAANYSRTAAAGTPLTSTVDNQQLRARYDHFFGDITLFLGAQGRRDRFQGLDLRLQVDPGAAYYFMNDKKQLAWLEAGYDYLHDIRRDDALLAVDKNNAPVLDEAGNQVRVAKTKSVHSGRAFFGYSNKLNEHLTFDAGLEYLLGLSDTTFWKLNGDASLSSKIANQFSIATALSLRYDHAPLPGKDTTDITTSVSLIYSLL